MFREKLMYKVKINDYNCLRSKKDKIIYFYYNIISKFN